MGPLATEPSALVDRYVAMWNEPEPDARRAVIRALWSPSGTQLLHSPPQDIRDTATSLGFASPALVVSGYEGLDARVTRAHEQFVAPGTFVFRRSSGPARPLRNVVTFGWEMAPTDGGDAAGSGFEVIVLDADGRIASDHQFVAS
jgi:hypothetical protein